MHLYVHVRGRWRGIVERVARVNIYVSALYISLVYYVMRSFVLSSSCYLSLYNLCGVCARGAGVSSKFLEDSLYTEYARNWYTC